jgi:membrane-associated protease RseP (regulator of RpoE activity)
MSAFTIIFGIISMVMIHEAGHFIAAKATGMKATEFFFGFGPRIWSFKRGETEYGVKAVPLGGYVRIVGMNLYEEVDPEDEGRTYREKPFWKKTIVVLAGVASHFVIAFLLFYVILVGIGLVDLTGSTRVAGISDTVPNTDTPAPSLLAGLQEGDVIVSLDGEATPDWDALTGLISERPGESVTLGVERGGAVISIEAVLASRERNGEDEGFLGIQPETYRVRSGPLEGFVEAGAEVGDAVVLSGRGMWQLFTGIGDLVGAVFSGERVSDEVRPASPIGIVRIGAGQDITFVLGLLAWVNIFVGLFNFLPVYPLDGGHFSVALYEKIRGRPADVQKLAPVAAAVVIFMILLGVLAVYLDIAQPFRLQ